VLPEWQGAKDTLELWTKLLPSEFGSVDSRTT
jgi:hypothetical protein